MMRVRSSRAGALMWTSWQHSWKASLSVRLFARTSRLRAVVRQFVVNDHDTGLGGRENFEPNLNPLRPLRTSVQITTQRGPDASARGGRIPHSRRVPGAASLPP